MQPDGAEHKVEGLPGMTVMEAAVKNSNAGIDADCGGTCACGTCHVYVEPGWQEKVGARNRMEEGMLELAFDARSNSRLCCQIRVSDTLEGLLLHVPESQG